ncbi:MAG: serine acetyltransferase [Planctomycetes bacterium]|nr:serine acetyltransferase [Planctomycetota bacterium]
MSEPIVRTKSAFHIDVEKYCRVLYKTVDPGVIRKVKLLVMNMGLHCIAVYRFGQFAKEFKRRHKVIGKPIRFAYLLMNYIVVLVHKTELHESSKIGPGFHISHVGNIFLGPCKIGANCTITHNVTIGLGLKANENGVPTIGNNVWIGTGSVVTGDINIGDGVTISAGSILTRSIPMRCLIAGNPARVISQEYDNSRLFVPT